MSIYKRGRVYWYDFVFEGKRYQATTKCKNKTDAESVEAAKRVSLAEKRVGLNRPNSCEECGAPTEGKKCDICAIPTLAEYAPRFTRYIERHAADKPNTIRFWKDKLARLLDYSALAKARLSDINESLIQDYIESRYSKVKNPTINRELATLRRILRRAKREDVIQNAPLITMLKGERNRTFVLNYQQEAKYLANAPQPLKDAALLMLETGLRAGECLNLEWKNIHLEPADGCRFGYLQVTGGKTRNAERNLSLTKAANEMLLNRSLTSNSTYVFDGFLVTSLCHQHEKVREALNLDPDFVIHGLRHTMLSRLGMSGADTFAIMKIAGHSSVTVSQKYVHPTPEHLENAFVRMEAFNRHAKGLTGSHHPVDAQSDVTVFTTVEGRPTISY